MKIIKRSIFFAAFLAVISMSTISMAQASRRQIDYANGKATLIVQYSGDFATHTARLSGDCDAIYYSGIECRFGSTNKGDYKKYTKGEYEFSFIRSYNKNVGKKAGTAYSKLYNNNVLVFSAEAKRD